MALVLADRVRETTTTVGTGTVTLAGAVPGYQSFSVVGNGNTTYYTIAGQGTSEWEVGIGTYTASGTTLARTTVLDSSNSGSLVPFSAGTKDVFVTYPADKSVNQDASGNVGIGTASPAAKLHSSQTYVVPSSGGISADTTGIFSNNSVANGTANVSILGRSSGYQRLYFGSQVVENAQFIEAYSVGNSTAYLAFGTGTGTTAGTERMRIDSAGNVGIGVTPSVGQTFTVGKNITGATTSSGVYVNSTIQSDVTSNGVGFRTSLLTQATAFTLTNLYHYLASQSTIGAGSTVTNQYGFYVDNGLVGATNNYGFHSNIASATNRWNFYAAGTANNYMAGQLQLGDGTAAAPALSNFGDENTGIFFPAADTIAFSEGGTEAMRITSTGAIAFNGASNYGTSGQVLTSAGNAPPTWTTSGYTLKGITYLTSGTSATYTTPANVRAIYVECVGGGAGGGYVDGQGAGTGAGAGGGGGGGYVAKLITSPSASYTYTIGAGGTGGTSVSNNGANGNATTFTDGTITLSADGGTGGTGITASASNANYNQVAGGDGSGGDIVIGGQRGGARTRGNFAQYYGGYGGGSIFGQGGGGGGGVNAIGQAATRYGCGGGGGGVDGTTSNYAGGDGFQGIIRITEYY